MSEGLSADDPGLRLLARAAAKHATEDILLVYCGDLPGLAVGATRLVLDVREFGGSRARPVSSEDETELAKLKDFGCAIVWPRAHLGKDFSLACLARGALSLRKGGQLMCAARKHKGAQSLEEFMVALLGNVDIVARDRGYRLMVSTHEGHLAQQVANEALQRRYSVSDPVLGDVELRSAPGLFSRRQLDDGTRELILHCAHWADASMAEPRRVIDLCAGIGPLAAWAARRWPQCEVLAIESNLRAVALQRQNMKDLGLDTRVSVLAHDGLPADEQRLSSWLGTVDLALVNPPTHAPREKLLELLAQLKLWMAPGSNVFVVVNRSGTATEGLKRAGARVEVHQSGAYSVLRGQW